MSANWFIDLLRTLFFFIDSIIYPLIGKVYNLLMTIANTTIFTEEVIDMFASKVYALLGIFMLFKVSFSILTYIVNPDEFADKNKGFSKIITNIIITLTLLVTTPWIFSQAMDIQRIVLKDDIIGRIFSVGPTSNISVDTAGDSMAYDTFSAFYYFDTEADSQNYCSGLAEGADLTNNNNCKSYFNNSDKYSEYVDTISISYSSKSINFYLKKNGLLNQTNSSGGYVMHYLPLISSVAGGFVCWILIMFCFDVAVRSIKLGFLRMISPIPIVSRIDPKKGMELFNKWVKNCLSTYIDLFVRLLAIHFALFVIAQIGDLDFVDIRTGVPTKVDAFVKVFIILGALLFAKELPKLLEELLGIKMGGKFTLDPRKKLGQVPLVGGMMSAGATMLGGAALAAGRGIANGIGGGARLGLGKAASALSKNSDSEFGKRVQTFGNSMQTSGRRIWSNTREAVRTRMDYTREEAHGRMSSSGLMGGDFKGSTAHQMYAKDREKERTSRLEGRKEFSEIHRQWERGEEIKQNIAKALGMAPESAKKVFDLFDGKTETAYELAYNNPEFRRSLMAFDKQDAKNKELVKAYESYKLGNDVKIGDRTYKAGNSQDALDIYDAVDKSQKTLKGLESVHNTMRKTYADDARIQDALKFNKYNENDPTSVSRGGTNFLSAQQTTVSTSTQSTSSSTPTASTTNVTTSSSSTPNVTYSDSVITSPTREVFEQRYATENSTSNSHQERYSDLAETFYSTTGTNYVAGNEAKVKHDSEVRIKSYSDAISNSQEQIAANIKKIEESKRIIEQNNPVMFTNTDEINMASQIREQELARVNELIKLNSELQSKIQSDYVEIERNKNYTVDNPNLVASESELVRRANEQINSEDVNSRIRYEEQLKKEIYEAADKTYQQEIERAKKEYHQWRESISEHNNWGTTVSEQRKIAEAEMKKSIEKINELQRKRQSLNQNSK